MKLFLDTANVEEIREANDLGVICGVTTNPSLIAKEGRDFKEVVTEITSIVDGPISAEVISMDHEGMVREALELVNGDGVSYTVPQHLRLEALEKPAQVFFRVNRVTRDAQILATDADGKTIARFKREHMAPGEMEQIGLPPQLLKQARGPLTLRIQEV